MKAATRIIAIEAVEPFTVTCRFADETIKMVDFGNYLQQHKQHRLVAPLLNPNYFMAVSLDEIGGLVWTTGFDCSPLTAYELGHPIA